MTRVAICVCTVMLATVVGLGSCKRVFQSRCTSKLGEVFSDFQFAGSIYSLSNLEAVSVARAASVPSRFIPGTKYVFYHRRLSSVYLFESQTIPSRLQRKRIGFKNLGPSSFGYPNEGGPLFMVELEGLCSGFIYNVVDPRIARDQSLSQIWASEAYIIELSGSDCT